MIRFGRARGLAKWVGTVVCLFLAWLWLVSFFVGMVWVRASGPGRGIVVNSIPTTVNDGIYICLANGAVFIFDEWEGPSYSRFGFVSSSEFRSISVLGLLIPVFQHHMIFIPPWIPLLIVGVPVLWAWWPVLRRRWRPVRVVEARWVLREWSVGRGRGVFWGIFAACCLPLPFLIVDMALHFYRGGTSVDGLAVWIAACWLGCAYVLARVAGLLLRVRRQVVVVVTEAGGPACPKCFYDLTGNESGRCSECGAVVGSAAR